MELVKGRIDGLAVDSRGILHIHFRKGFHLYKLWAADHEIIQTLVSYNNDHGAYMDMPARPLYLRFDEISYEITEVIQDS